MIFQVNLSDAKSVYRQICDQVKYAVATGVLAPGDRLPAIREVAARTRVNRNTIAKAYTELERESVILSRPGQGSFVANGSTALQKQQRMKIIEGMVRDFYVQGYHFQISPEELRAVVERVGRKFEKEGQS